MYYIGNIKQRGTKINKNLLRNIPTKPDFVGSFNYPEYTKNREYCQSGCKFVSQQFISRLFSKKFLNVTSLNHIQNKIKLQNPSFYLLFTE